jgi:ribonuclease D
VQVAIRDEVYCIDPLALRGRLDPLLQMVCDPSVQKLVHAASMDLRVFYEHSSRPAMNVFDTQVAAGLLGHGVSAYGELVKMCCGVSLTKGSTMTDWLKRPLQDEQLRYAEDDVLYLGAVVDDLTAQLRDRGRFGWFEQECAKFGTEQYYSSLLRDPLSVFPRVRKVKSLEPLEQVKAFRLVQWREQEAASQDKPPNFLMRDDALTEIAKLTPTSARDLLEQGSRVVHPNLAKYNGNAIVRLLQAPATQNELSECAGLLSSPASPVEATKKELARANAVFSLMHAFFLSVCAAQDIEPTYVASQANLKYFVTEAVTGQLPWGDIGPDGLVCASTEGTIPAHREILSGWRWGVAGKSLVKFLQGDISVSYDPETSLPKFADGCAE